MSFLIAHVESQGSEDAEPGWKGYVYAITMLITLVLTSISNAFSAHYMYILGMHIKTVVTSAVYKKALKLSGTAKKESTVGEIVNLMAVDVQRFMDLVPYLNMLL